MLLFTYVLMRTFAMSTQNDESNSDSIEAFELNLEKARQTMQLIGGTERGKVVLVRLIAVFDAAEQILRKARSNQLQVH
jgi:hypothetical protein